VDTRLRLESGAGPLARLSFQFTDRAALERQMLIARPVGGCGARRQFIDQVQPFVYPGPSSPSCGIHRAHQSAHRSWW
jgi:hypothetical protein